MERHRATRTPTTTGSETAGRSGGEAPNGLSIPESDPLHRDLYVDIVELRNATDIQSHGVASLREAYATMPVENPDGEQGIRLHVDGPRRVDVTVQDLHDRTDYQTSGIAMGHVGQVLYTSKQMGLRRGISHLLVVVPPETNLHDGGSGAASWKIAVLRDPTTRVVVHELLHTITDPEAFAQSCNGQSHTCRGYLSYTSDTHFSKATTAWLANNSYGNNDAEVGGKTYRDP